MASEKIIQILDRIKAQGKMDFNAGATAEQIMEFEKETGIALPSKYKEWLMLSDGGYFFLPGGAQLYGVVHKPQIDIGDDDRPDDSFIVIGALLTGDPILFKKNNEQISIYNHEADRIEKEETFEDFYAFLDKLYDLLGIGE